MWYIGWHTIIVLADNYLAGLLTSEIKVILFTQALPTFSVLADYYWAPECTKITLLVINFLPGASTKFQEISSISRSCRHPVSRLVRSQEIITHFQT